MKRILLVLVLTVGLSASVTAQEVLSITLPTAAVQARVDRARVSFNANTCSRLSTVAVPLTASCTQGQACTAAGAAGGAGCTAAQARATTPSSEIFAASTAGRSNYATVLFRNDITQMQTNSVAEDRAAFCVWWLAASTGAQDAACTGAGLAAGCTLCQ